MKKILLGILAIGTAAAFAADEITITTYLAVKNGAFEYMKNISQLRRDQATLGSSMNVQSIQTNAAELIVIAADVATNGYSFFRNVTTNTDRVIDVGITDTNFTAMMRLEAGDVALLRLHPTEALYAQAVRVSGTNAITGVDLENWILRD